MCPPILCPLLGNIWINMIIYETYNIYGSKISVSVDNYHTYKLAVIRAFNKSRGG